MGEYETKFNSYIADELRAQRGRKRITVDALAERTGLSAVTVARYLKGQRQIPLGVFGELCLVLELDATDLFTRAHQAAQ